MTPGWRSRAPPALLVLSLIASACLGGGDQPPRSAPPPPAGTQAPQPAPPSEDELRALAVAEFGAGALVQRLDVPAGWEPAWLVATAAAAATNEGLLSIYRVIYRARGPAWREVDRLHLDQWRGVRQIPVAPNEVWLQAGDRDEEGRGYRLLSFDGSALSLRFEAPALRGAKDYDGDGLFDVVVDASLDPCRGCGAIEALVEIHRWDGEQLSPARLQRLPPSAPARLREAVDRAVELAEADLWIDATQAIAAAVRDPDLGPFEETVAWDHILIDLLAHERRELGVHSEMPLVTYVLAGDYEAAVDLLRGLAPAELFDAGGPLLAGLPTAESKRAVASLLIERAGRAVAVRRDLAAAYFVRGLGRYLLDPEDVVTARADIRQALGLEPYDDFYAAASQFLQAIPRPAQPSAD